jgi:RHS repeat-associated protein
LKFSHTDIVGSGNIDRVNWWYDPAITPGSSVPVVYFYIRELVCAVQYNWDDVANNCVKPIKEPCPKNSPSVGKPCDPATGNEHYTETDYTGAGPFPLNFSRTYNSKVTGNGRLGFNWVSSFGDPTGTSTLSVNTQVTPNFAQVPRPGGRAVFFRKVNGIWTPDSDITDTLTQTAEGWIYTQRNGIVETYNNTIDLVGNSSGQLISITNDAGLSQTMTYEPATGYLGAVTDPFGHSLTFAYDAKGRLSTMTNPNGGVTSYAYDDTNNVGNLSTVTYPDLKFRRYTYNEPGYVATGTNYPNALTGIYDENNNRYASLTYDTLGRVIVNQLADVGNGGPQQKYTLSYDSATQTTVTDAVNNRVVMTFATNLDVKNLVSNKNLTDNKILYQTFDANNNLTCKQDEEGRVTTWTYNAANQKLSETTGRTGTCAAPVNTAATRTTAYQYLSNDLDLPTLVEAPSVAAGQVKRTSIGYSGKLPVSITQSGFTPAGAAVARTVAMTYNASGQVASIDGPRTDVNDVTTLNYYNCTTGGACGQLQSVTNALGQTATYDSYDANGRPLSLIDPNGLKTLYTYDVRGRVATVTQTAPGGGSRVTQYGYDAAGNVTSTLLPTGLSLTYTYNAAKYMTRVVDSLGNRIDYGYDLKGNRTQTYTYDHSGTLVRSVDLAFDARNRVIQINAGGSITQQISDAVGNLTKVTDPNTVAVSGSAATNNSYDALNRLYQTVDRLSGSTLYSYDANDHLKTVQTPNGASTQYQYDDLGNLLKEISPDRGTVSYVYDAAGNLAQQTDARGIVSSYTYDALNRLTRIDYPGTTEDVTYSYDSASGCNFGLGRLCSVVDESGGTAYGYDDFGNQLVQTHTELGITYNTFYTYDAGNRVTSITYPDSRTASYQRDVLGRITAVTTSVNGTAVTVASARRFRPDGLLLSQSFGNGLNEVRQYDTQGRLTYQSLASADTRLYTYDANGNLKGLQSLPLVGTYNYDALDRLSLDQRTATATTSSTFTYDANGNRQSENLGSYAYLANSNRLSSTPQGSITLDAAGNTLSDGTRSYTYNNAGHVSTVADAGYSYNAQRLRSRKIVGSVGTVYHYDLGGNLLAESDTAGALRRTYVWADGQPLAQIEPVTTLPPDMIVDNSQATFTGTWGTATKIADYYGANYQTNTKGNGKDKAVWAVNVPSTGTYQVYARWVAASTHASNAPFTVQYSGGSQTVSANQRVSGGQWMLLGNYAFTAGSAGSVTLTDNANGTVIADAVKLVAVTGGTTSEVVRYLHSDHLNTPRLATNPQAQVIWRWEGTAFGETVPNEDVDGDGKLTTINLRFPGQLYDAETGLHYNWNRYYDPRIGRYITADPVSVGEHVQSTLDNLRSGRANDQPPLDLNPYAYVANNPLKYIDPEGLACEYKGFDYGGWVIGKKMCRCIWECGCPDAKTTKYTYGKPIYVRGREPITSKVNACDCEFKPNF